MELAKRKHTRLNNFDYRQSGAYFVTICTNKRRPLLSSIIEDTVLLTDIGRIAEKQLQALSKRYPFLQICQYVIMPNHIHILLQLKEDTAGASPRPTLMDIICAYKSLTARESKDYISGSLFQTSFYDHVVRSEQEFMEIWQYIEDNPAKWLEDKYFLTYPNGGA